MLMKNDGMSLASGIYRLGAQTKKFASDCVRKSHWLKTKPGNTFLDGSLRYRAA